jgi:hypothetical protein
MYDLAGTPFEDFAGTLFLNIWWEFLLSLKRRAKCTKGGRSPPPSFGKRGLPPILKYQKYWPLRYRYGKYRENTEGFIPKYRIGISLWEGCRNFGILLLKIERVPFSRHNLRTHQYDTQMLEPHRESWQSQLSNGIGVWGSRTELLWRNITLRKRFRLLFFRF